MKPIWVLVLFFLMPLAILAQPGKGVIEGRVYNAQNNEPVPFANIVIWQTTIGSVSNFDGEFKFTGVEPGYVKLKVSSVGYETYVTEAFMVTNAKPVYLEIPMQEKTEQLEEVVITASPFRLDKESPVSLRRIGVEQIEKSPGANRDISRVIQNFPGVASSVSFRNDVIVGEEVPVKTVSTWMKWKYPTSTTLLRRGLQAARWVSSMWILSGRWIFIQVLFRPIVAEP